MASKKPATKRATPKKPAAKTATTKRPTTKRTTMNSTPPAHKAKTVARRAEKPPVKAESQQDELARLRGVLKRIAGRKTSDMAFLKSREEARQALK